MTKTLKELNLEDDFLFAKVMSDKGICKEFLEKLLEIKIEKIEIPENQKTIDLLLETKGIRLDIYVKDQSNTVYNVEMQRGNHRNLPKRLRYYQGNIDLDLINKGDDYRKLSKSYIIFICTFDLFKSGRHKYTFETVCVEDNNIKLNDDTNKIILNTTGVIKDLSDELIDFLKYVEHSDDATAKESTGTLVKNIHKRVIEVKNNPNVEVEFMTLLERDREKLEEGIEEGIELAKKVFKLLNNGESISNIAKICNISEEKVKKIIE